MTKTRFGMALAACACVSLAVAQTYPEFTAGMKAAAAATDALGKQDQKTGPATVRAAERLGAVYEEMIGFWRQRNSADAVKWSEAGKAAAVELASAANAADAERANAAFKTLNGTCRSCHEIYRERLADGSYRFKEPKQQ